MKLKIWHIVLTALLVFLLIRQCEGEPKVVTKTETIIKWKTDSVYVDKIIEREKKVYVQNIKTIKGKDSIIYLEKPNDNSITASQYNVKLKSNDATADLLITSETKPLDVTGTITYPEKETITTITKTRDASGFYIYGSNPINTITISPELGILYQFKNKLFISTSAQFNNITNQTDIKVGLGIKIF